ncbi:MAG TPA: LapA family protein [Nitrososphaeraceae archaeon]|nr:LapA family protein [Nitrososphaeraceae archaeon]
MISLFTLSIFGCIPELSSGCVDMTNSSSTYLGVVIGALIGVIISWWIYYRQKKTTEKQDEVIKKIEDLEELHLTLLKKIESIDEQHDKTLRSILNIEERFEEERIKNMEG